MWILWIQNYNISTENWNLFQPASQDTIINHSKHLCSTDETRVTQNYSYLQKI
ncbi:hypothetical protein Hanom_Chr12g01093551 [Helianthus anomalus]